MCTGAFVLAQAGLLDGRRATTHWFYARRLQREYPRVKVDEDRIFVADGPIWTSAGMSAGIDRRWPWWKRTWGRKWRAPWRASWC